MIEGTPHLLDILDECNLALYLTEMVLIMVGMVLVVGVVSISALLRVFCPRIADETVLWWSDELRATLITDGER